MGGKETALRLAASDVSLAGEKEAECGSGGARFYDSHSITITIIPKIVIVLNRKP
jgi:hypothetical protein